MPTCILTCERCNEQRPFFIHEEALPEIQNGKPVSGTCPVCRTTTNFTFAFLERRSGRDRRSGTDRRVTE